MYIYIYRNKYISIWQRHPASARHLWSQVLTRALAAVVHYNDSRAWQELLMLLQAVLCAPPPTGRKHKRASAAFTLDRLHYWDNGERECLWSTRPAGGIRPHGPHRPEQQRRRHLQQPLPGSPWTRAGPCWPGSPELVARNSSRSLRPPGATPPRGMCSRPSRWLLPAADRCLELAFLWGGGYSQTCLSTRTDSRSRGLLFWVSLGPRTCV